MQWGSGIGVTGTRTWETGTRSTRNGGPDQRNRQWKHGTTALGSSFSCPDIAHGSHCGTNGSPGIMDGRPHFAHGRPGSTDGSPGIRGGSPGSTSGRPDFTHGRPVKSGGRPDLARRRPESAKSSTCPASPAPQSAAALQVRRNGLAPPLQKLLSTAVPLAGFPKDVLRLPVTLPMDGTSCLAGLSPGSVAKSSFPPRLSGAVMAEQSIDCLFFNFPNGPSHPQ